MREIILDDEFMFLLPTLDAETYRLLEENILQYGVRDPLVLWNDILIDGYNRYKICNHHNIPFDTINMDFESREEVLIWIISNQVSRRNLTPIQLSHFRGLHYKADKKIRGPGCRFVQNRELSQNETFQPGSTANRLSEHYNVSRNTIIRDSKLAEGVVAIGEISPDAKRKILSGEVRVGKSRLEELSSASKDEIKQIADAIESGTFEGGARRSAAHEAEISDETPAFPELQKLNDIISDFAKNFNNMFRKVKSSAPAELKPVLRSYIDRLEELYGKMQ